MQRTNTLPPEIHKPSADKKETPRNSFGEIKKVEAPVKKVEVITPIASKTGNSSTNNTIGQRNQKNAKERDCEIY